MSDKESEDNNAHISSIMDSFNKLGKLQTRTSLFSNQIQNIFPAGTSYKIEPLSDIVKLSRNEYSIILFELIPIELLDSINDYFLKNHKRHLLNIEKRIESKVYQNAQNYFTINLPLSIHVIETVLCANYHFGNFAQLIIICKIQIDDLDHNDDDSEQIILKRMNKINEIHKEIESKIPNILHGFFFTNEIHSFDKPFNLPSLILFDSSPYLHFLEKSNSTLDSLSLGNNTERGRADNFLNEFKINPVSDDPANHLEKIGICPIILTGLIDNSLIISVDDLFFEHSLGRLACRYVGLHFQPKSQIIDDEILLEFVNDLSLNISIDSILTKIRIDLERIKLTKFSNFENENELKMQKQSILSIQNDLMSVEDTFLLYTDAIKDSLDKHALGYFIHEETWVSTVLGSGSDARSISDYFDNLRTNKINDIKTQFLYKKERLEDSLELINTELNLIKDRPTINSFLKDVESDLVNQIIKWKGKISEKTIQEWLLNFQSTDDRKLALEILNKISYVTYDDLKSLCPNLYHRIQTKLGDAFEKCRFSFIGEVTSGSAHIQKLFQEQNHISKENFFSLEQLPPVSEPTPLILLDDFIGSGKTFSKWFKKTKIIQDLQKNNYQIHYCVLTAFEKGKSFIENEVNVSVTCGYLYEKNQQVKDGSIFSNDIKTKIIELVERYAPEPLEYLWGYDECQLLIAFQNNIPNNSLSILWSDQAWTPLIERK